MVAYPTPPAICSTSSGTTAARYVDKDGKPALKSDGTLTAIKRIQQWWKDKVIPPDSVTWDDTGNNNAYQSKQVAFAINPPSIYDWMQKNDKELLNNTTMAAIPAGKAGSFAGSGSWSWSVFVGSKNVDGAKALIDYWMVPDNCQAVYEKVGGRWYPIYKDLKNKEYWTSRPHFKFYPDMIAAGRQTSYPAAPEPNLMTALGDVRGAVRRRRHDPGRGRQEPGARAGTRRGSEGDGGDLQEVQAIG